MSWTAFVEKLQVIAFFDGVCLTKKWHALVYGPCHPKSSWIYFFCKEHSKGEMDSDWNRHHLSILR
jgi:hypothetical protein